MYAIRSYYAVAAPRTAEVVVQVLEEMIARLKDRSFASLLERALPEGSLALLREVLAERLLATLRSPTAREAFESYNFV